MESVRSGGRSAVGLGWCLGGRDVREDSRALGVLVVSQARVRASGALNHGFRCSCVRFDDRARNAHGTREEDRLLSRDTSRKLAVECVQSRLQSSNEPTLYDASARDVLQFPPSCTSGW